MTVSLYSLTLIPGEWLTASYCTILNISNSGTFGSYEIIDLARSVNSFLMTEGVSHLKAMP